MDSILKECDNEVLRTIRKAALCPKDRVIVALDAPNAAEALMIVEQTHKYVGCYKVGLELIVSQHANSVIAGIKHRGAKVFLDAKLNDIPTTVGRTVATVAHDVHMINVHAMCGIEAMSAAVKSAKEAEADNKCMVLAVTVLTSLSAIDLEKIGIQISGEYTDEDAVGQLVVKLAQAAKQAGVTGLICSPKDIGYLQREHIDASFWKVTPGIRPSWTAANDQKRIMTPSEAVKAGSDYIVIGRPITQPPDGITREEAAHRVFDELSQISS